MSRLPPDPTSIFSLYFAPMISDSYIEIERISLTLINRDVCDNLPRFFLQFNFSTNVQYLSLSIVICNSLHTFIDEFILFNCIEFRKGYIPFVRIKADRGIGVKLFQRGGSLVDETASFPGDWRLVAVSLKGDNDEATRKGFRKGLRKSTFPPSRHAFRSW